MAGIVRQVVLLALVVLLGGAGRAAGVRKAPPCRMCTEDYYPAAAFSPPALLEIPALSPRGRPCCQVQSAPPSLTGARRSVSRKLLQLDAVKGLPTGLVPTSLAYKALPCCDLCPKELPTATDNAQSSSSGGGGGGGGGGGLGGLLNAGLSMHRSMNRGMVPPVFVETTETHHKTAAKTQRTATHAEAATAFDGLRHRVPVAMVEIARQGGRLQPPRQWRINTARAGADAQVSTGGVGKMATPQAAAGALGAGHARMAQVGQLPANMPTIGQARGAAALAGAAVDKVGEVTGVDVSQAKMILGHANKGLDLAEKAKDIYDNREVLLGQLRSKLEGLQASLMAGQFGQLFKKFDGLLAQAGLDDLTDWSQLKGEALFDQLRGAVTGDSADQGGHQTAAPQDEQPGANKLWDKMGGVGGDLSDGLKKAGEMGQGAMGLAAGMFGGCCDLCHAPSILDQGMEPVDAAEE